MNTEYTCHSVEKRAMAVKFRNFHNVRVRTRTATVWKNEKSRQIKALVFSLVNTLLSRNFCQKCVMF